MQVTQDYYFTSYYNVQGMDLEKQYITNRIITVLHHPACRGHYRNSVFLPEGKEAALMGLL